MKTPEENVLDTLKGKKVLFIERDNYLAHGLDEFERILKRGKIKYKALFDVANVSMDKIVKDIKKHDVIVFQTQWIYPISKKLSEYMFALEDKKIVIECHIGDPTWYYKPDCVHDVYIYKCPICWGEPDKALEKFYKLSDEPYWDYKNKFDK